MGDVCDGGAAFLNCIHYLGWVSWKCIAVTKIVPSVMRLATLYRFYILQGRLSIFVVIFRGHIWLYKLN